MVLRGDVDADEGGEDEGDCVIDDDDADDDDDLSPFGLSNCINSSPRGSGARSQSSRSWRGQRGR